MANILDTIVERKKIEVDKLPKAEISIEELRDRLSSRGRRGFIEALRNPRVGDVGLIAEVKKASPSKGVIRPDFDPVKIAREYEAAGASCLSVLTDEHFFQGSLDYLKRVRASVGIPLLRKDFMIDERQFLEAVEWGADAVLLIVAILDEERLRRFHELATGAGLAALVEVHDEDELDRAMELNPALIGVNNRDLKTFQVDLGTTERLAGRIEDRLATGKTTLVAESGIFTRADVERLQACGSKSILVGESLMREADMGSKVRELINLATD